MVARRRKAPANPKYVEAHEGRVDSDEEYGMVLFLTEQTLGNASYGIASGGLIDARLVGKRVRVTVEEL